MLPCQIRFPICTLNTYLESCSDHEHCRLRERSSVNVDVAIKRDVDSIGRAAEGLVQVAFFSFFFARIALIKQRIVILSTFLCLPHAMIEDLRT